MADATVVLPPQQRSIAAHEGGMSSNLGPPLPKRVDLPTGLLNLVGGSGSPGVVIDIGGADGPEVEIGDDGSISAPYIRERREDEYDEFGDNLAETGAIDEQVLAQLASDIMDGVDADELSRTEWIRQYNTGLDLLGLKIEEIEDRESKGDVSRANDSTLIEAMVKYRASAEAELCPAAGPVKVPTIGQSTPEEDELAKAFEDDFNYYLTDVAEEYYPDTASMLMHQAFCGIGYKKVYFCPLRRRPVSESVLAPSLIVSEDATDLQSARRVTHEIEMTRPMLRRMQIVGQYRDIDLGQPQGYTTGIGGTAMRKIRETEGLAVVSTRPQDQPYVIRETDTDIDLVMYDIAGKYERAAPEGLPLPYKITLERGTRKVLGVWRNWKEGDQLYLKQNCYVKFGMIPGMGYHNWGFRQLLGNQTRNMRSIIRLMITCGMYANFPGGMKNKNARMSTNEIMPAPGEWPDVDVPPSADLSKMFFPMPYKPLDPMFVQVLELIKQDAMRLGGTVMLEVGEGRTNVPVGTVLAMIEQQVQVMAGVHKNNHRAQKAELRKLRELFADKPELLSLMCRERPRDATAPYRQWQRAEEFTNLNLQPASDPNVPSQVHRVMLANVLVMLAINNPQIYDIIEVHRSALQAIGAAPDRFLRRPDQIQSAPPDPKAEAALLKQQNEQQETLINAQQQADKNQIEREKIQSGNAQSLAENITARQVSQSKAQTELEKAAMQHGGAPVVTGIGGEPMPIP